MKYAETRKDGRSTLPLRDLEYLSDVLYKAGARKPPLTVKDFFQAIRRGESDRMSYEYKILGKICPVYYDDERVSSILKKVYPFEHYHDIKELRRLWTGAFVMLVLDEETENEYMDLRRRYENAEQKHRNSFSLPGARTSEIIENHRLAKKCYLDVRALIAAINSRDKEDLGVGLTLRGLLAYLYSENERRKSIQDRKDRREAEEKDKEKAAGWRMALVKRSSTRIHEVIRNPFTIKEAPFLEGSELFESLGFDVLSLLLQISLELIDQLHIDIDKDRYLLRRATERYLAEFNRFFFDGLRGAVKKRYPMNIAILKLDKKRESTLEQIANGKSVISLLNEYRKKMALQRKVWVLDDLKETDRTINESLKMDDALKKEDKSSDN